MRIDMSLNTSGTRCPVPLLRAKVALRRMKVGQQLEVLATDPSAHADFQLMLKHMPHEMISFDSAWGANGIFRFIIRKGEDLPNLAGCDDIGD